MHQYLRSWQRLRHLVRVDREFDRLRGVILEGLESGPPEGLESRPPEAVGPEFVEELRHRAREG